jgi:hypothetical protein
MRRVKADQIQAIGAWPRARRRPADSRRYGRKLIMRARETGRWAASASLTGLSADPSRDSQQEALARLSSRTIQPSGASRL